MAGVSWIISGAQYLTKQGELSYAIIPVTIDACDNHIIDAIVSNVTEIAAIALWVKLHCSIWFRYFFPFEWNYLFVHRNVTTTTQSPLNLNATVDHPFSIYRMAFMWYPIAGTIIFALIAIPVSHLTGAQDIEKLDLNLLSPVAKCLVPKRLRHIEMQLCTATKVSPDKSDLKEGTEWVWKNSQVVLDSKEKEALQ